MNTDAQDGPQSVTYLQCLDPYDRLVDSVAQVGAKFGDEVIQHLEFIRLNGYMTASGIPVIRYCSPERLYEIIAGYEAWQRKTVAPELSIAA